MHTINTFTRVLAAKVEFQTQIVLTICAAFLMVLTAGLTNHAYAVSVPVPSGLVAHFDAQENSSIINSTSGIASDGELVSSWNDLVAGIHDATPISLTTGPTYNATGAPNNLPSLTFDGAGDHLRTVSSALEPVTLVFFHRWIPDPDTGGEYLLDTRSGVTNGYVWSGGVGDNWTYYLDDSTTPGSGAGAIQNGLWHMTTFTGIDSGPNRIALMSPGSTGESSPGDLGELLIYNRVITEEERLQLFDYIDTRWVNLPPVPEPSSFALLSLGALCLIRHTRRRKRRA